MTKFKIKNALVSLTDKNKIEIVAKKLKELDIEIPFPQRVVTHKNNPSKIQK